MRNITRLFRRCYAVALVSRIDKIMRLFCKRALWKRQYSAKETHNLIDLTDRSHPIALSSSDRRESVRACVCVCVCVYVCQLTTTFATSPDERAHSPVHAPPSTQQFVHNTLAAAMNHIDTCDMTHSYVWHDSFVCVIWLIHRRNMTHSTNCLRQRWFTLICVTWLVF